MSRLDGLAQERRNSSVSAMELRLSCTNLPESTLLLNTLRSGHDDIIKWKHFPRYWSFVRGIHRSPVNSPHKGQWRGALMFSLICVWINGWVNNREAGYLRRYHAHYDVAVMDTYESVKLVTLVQVMACCQFGTKPLQEPMLSHCQMDPYE